MKWKWNRTNTWINLLPSASVSVCVYSSETINNKKGSGYITVNPQAQCVRIPWPIIGWLRSFPLQALWGPLAQSDYYSAVTQSCCFSIDPLTNSQSAPREWQIKGWIQDREIDRLDKNYYSSVCVCVCVLNICLDQFHEWGILTDTWTGKCFHLIVRVKVWELR